MSSDFQLESKLRRLRRRIDDIVDDNDATAVQATLSDLAERINTIEATGYHFLGTARDDLRDAAEELATLKPTLAETLTQVSEDLRARVNEAADEIGDVDTEDDDSVEAAEEALDAVDDSIREAADEVETLLEAPRANIERIERRLDYVESTLEKQEEAGFAFDGSEQLVLADRAEWFNDDDDPDGFLYLTSERLLFEQKEKTGKMLGLFGGSMEQEVEWEHTLTELASATESDEGMLGRKSMLQVDLTSGESYSLEIKGGGNNDIWERLLNEAAAGRLTPVSGNAHTLIQAAMVTPMTPENVERLVNYRTVGAEESSDTPLEATLNKIALSRDASRVLTNALYDLRVWDTASGAILYQSDAKAYSPVLSPDGTWLAVAELREGERTKYDIIIREVETGDVLHTIELGSYFASQNAIVLSSDGQYLACRVALDTPPDETFIYDTATWQRVQDIDEAGAMAFSADGSTLAISYEREINPMQGTHKRKTLIYAVDSGDLLASMDDIGHSSQMAFAPDGSLIIVGGTAWDYTEQTQRYRVTAANKEDLSLFPPEVRKQMQKQGRVAFNITFTPDGSLLAGTSSKLVHFHDAQTGELLHKLPPHENSVYEIALSGDGCVLATNCGGSMPGSRLKKPNSGVRLWRVE